MIRPKGNFTTKHYFLLSLLFLVPLAMLFVRLTGAHPLSTALLDRWASFGSIPSDVQARIGHILFVPFAALVIVFVRLTLGIRMLGPFRSILLAVAFQTTGIVPGVLFLALVMTSVAIIRPVLKDMRLTYFARVSVVLGTVAGTTIAVVVAADSLGIDAVERVAYFPIIALCLVAEAFARTLTKEGFRGALWRGSVTSALAVLIVLLTRVPGLEAALLRLPELLFIQMGCIVAISEFFDLRLLDFLNPRSVRADSADDSADAADAAPPPESGDLSPRRDHPCPEVEESPVAGATSFVDQKPATHDVEPCAERRTPRVPVARPATAPKIAVVCNRDAQSVLHRFGRPCPERYGTQSVQRVLNAIRANGLTACVLEADLTLTTRLQEYFGPASPDDPPCGLVFNMAYGWQGECRYTQVPALLEMAGVPYTGATPLGHAVSLDKVTAKILMRQAGVPTPAFTVMASGDEDMGGLRFPLIVKPRHESTSYGLRLVHDRDELREAVADVMRHYEQEALVEEYIDGREVCLALIGNDPPGCLPIVEQDFGGRDLRALTLADKYHEREDEPQKLCPAPLEPAFTERLRRIAVATFDACHCLDYARVDVRIDREGNPFVLEINSMVSLGMRSSYVLSAAVAGSDWNELIRRILDVAYQRYFGEPLPFPEKLLKEPPEPLWRSTGVVSAAGDPV